MQLSSPDKSFDYIILSKLYWRYRAFNHTELGVKKQTSSHLKCILGIQPIRNRSTGIVVYKAYIRSKNQTDYLGTFPTLQSAVEAKITFFQNSGRTKGLNQLLNKLKELTCQQN
jgi:penicillin-binding protein-related factor A (putative recombinase)